MRVSLCLRSIFIQLFLCSTSPTVRENAKNPHACLVAVETVRCEEGTGFNSYGIGKKLVCFVSLLDKVKRCATVWSWPRSTPCSLTEKGPGGRRRDVSGPGGVGASLWTPSAPARAACPESVPVVRADPRPGPRPAAGRRLQGTMGHRCVCQ